MNTLCKIYQDKKFFRLKESAKSELWDVCTELDIPDAYDKPSELLISAMRKTRRMKNEN